MAKHRSITERLARAKSLEAKEETVKAWSKNWADEQVSLIARLEQAVKHDDYDELCIVAGQLKAMTEKRFVALPKVLQALIDIKKAPE